MLQPKHQHRRSWSFSFETNRLTKRNYSLSETTMARTPLSALTSTRNHGTNKTDRNKSKPHRSFLKTFHSRFEPLLEVETPTAKSAFQSQQPRSYHSLTQPNIKPKFTLLKLVRKPSERPRPQIRLLNNRMKKWDNINRNLQKLIPVPPVKPQVKVPIKPKPIVTAARVVELTEDLVKHLEHFWNIYLDAAKMTHYLAGIEGFTQPVRGVLMVDGTIHRITSPERIYKHFEIFKPQEERVQDYVMRDVQLHSALQYYTIKIQQKARVCHRDFSLSLRKTATSQMKSLETKIKDAQKNNHWEHIDTLRFLAAKRLNLPAYNRQDSLKNLQDLGVKLNIQQRMKDSVISSKELINYGLRQQLEQLSRPPKFAIVSRLFGRRT